MNKIKFLILTLLSIFAFSCEDDLETPPGAANFDNVAPVLVDVVDNVTDILFKKNEGLAWDTLSWNPAQYIDEDLTIHYSIQIDDAGSSFDSPIEISAESDMTTEIIITVGDLNTALLANGYNPVQEYNLELRVKAFVHKDLETVYSQASPFTVTTYKDVPIPDALYIFGDATTVAWDASASLAMYKEEGKYTVFTYLENGKEFRFLANQAVEGDSDFKYNYGSFAILPADVENAGGDNNNLKFTGVTGWYKIEADFVLSTLTIASHVVESTTYGYDYDNLYIVGDYNSTDPTWDADNAVAFTKVSEGVFTIQKELKDGAMFKFLGQQSWGDLDWGNIKEEGNSGTLGPKNFNNNITFDGGDAVFNITVDIKSGTYTIIAEPVYPTELFMTGSGVGEPEEDWNWHGELKFVPVHSHPELFWKIVWMKGSGEFKCAPQAAWDGGDFGKTGDATDGIYTTGGDNIPVPSTEGYYMVVVDLDNNTVEITDPKVYGMGDVFGGWDGGDPADLFTVDNANNVIKFEGVPNDGELRMYVDASTLNCDWWQAEFIVLNDMIEFRGTGDDQERVNVTTGDNITLNFRTGAGSITTP